MKRRELVLAAVAAGFGAGVNAQGSFPPAGMTIKYVVPFPPGGLTDVMARIVGRKLSETWKAPVMVENTRAPMEN